MSELIGSDETLFSLWPEHFLCKSGGIDWPVNQQVVGLPVVFLDDGRIAFRSDNGQIHLLDGLQGVGLEATEDVLLPGLGSPPTELPTLSDATIKSMLVHGSLDAELPLAEPSGHELPIGKHLPELGGKDMQNLIDRNIPDLTGEHMPPSPMDIDLKSLVLYHCNYCPFSSADVPSLMLHFKTNHEQLEPAVKNGKDNSEPDQETANSSLIEDCQDKTEEPIRNVVVYLCSECRENFSSVEDCRDHMINNHSMVVKHTDDQETVEVEDEDEATVSVAAPEVTPPTPSSPPPTPPPPVTTPPTTNTQPPPKVLKKPRAVKLKDYDPEYEAKPYKCTESHCACKFKSASFLDLHLECHLSDDTCKFCCPHCSMLFKKWTECAIHLWKEHTIDVDLLTCKVCNSYKTTTSKKLKSHIKIHSNERPYKCTVCDKGFKQRPQLVNHVASVHNKDKGNGVSPKWYMTQKCEICFKAYADSKCLKKHMQAVHKKLKPYKCHICDHMCAHKAMLKAHMRQHTGEKPFACEICSFKTGDHNSLRRHTMRHTGKKQYKCPHCPYSCIQSSSMKSHIVNRHPGLGGTYSCKQCYFETVNEKNYNNHMSDHKLNLIPPSKVEVFPENVAAAHLVYRSLGASPSQLHRNLTASSTSRDGKKQTITISIPQEDSAMTDDEDTTQYLLGDILDTGGITIPADPETLPC